MIRVFSNFFEFKRVVHSLQDSIVKLKNKENIILISVAVGAALSTLTGISKQPIFWNR